METQEITDGKQNQRLDDLEHSDIKNTIVLRELNQIDKRHDQELLIVKILLFLVLGGGALIAGGVYMLLEVIKQTVCFRGL